MLPMRKSGRQGLEVSMLGLGRMGMSQSYGPADEMCPRSAAAANG
jgi:aryl-alcohol dehydrogenase-like predicted oxidoreductase